jgi:hypothetical protein
LADQEPPLVRDFEQRTDVAETLIRIAATAHHAQAHH